MSGKRAKQVKAVDPDLEVWAKLGGGVTEAEARELTPGERIVAEGNVVVREWLNPSTWRPAHMNPFQRNR
jgi:hypothetical protein